MELLLKNIEIVFINFLLRKVLKMIFRKFSICLGWLEMAQGVL